MPHRSYIITIRRGAKIVLTFVVAPLTISFLADFLKGQPFADTPTAIWSAIVAVIAYAILVLLTFTSLLDAGIIALRRASRKRAYRHPSVLILDGTTSHDQQVPPGPTRTPHTPDFWLRRLAASNPRWKVKLGATALVTAQPQPEVIVNPFGEAYPEADPHTYATFHQLSHYVFSGGVFVTVAGIPFYYAHDPTDPVFVNRHIAAGQIKRIFESDPMSFTVSPLFRDLFPQLGSYSEAALVDCAQDANQIERYGDIATAGGNNRATMFRAFEPRIPGVLPMLTTADRAHSVITAIPYGDGVFLICGMNLDAPEDTGVEKELAAIAGWVRYEARGRPVLPGRA